MTANERKPWEYTPSKCRRCYVRDDDSLAPRLTSRLDEAPHLLLYVICPVCETRAPEFPREKDAIAAWDELQWPEELRK